VLFVGLGWYAVEAGGGAVAVLVVYILTNLVTAIATGLVVHRVGRGGEGAVPALLDAEARRSAVGFALLALGPRVTPLLLSVLAASDTVATYAVAWRPVEGVSLLAISLVTPVLPMLRSLHTRGKSAELDRAVQSVSHATIVALLPIVLWFLVAPDQVIRLLVGSDKYSEAEPLLSILAAVVLTWFLRSLAEATLLAREKAGTFAAITTTGFAFTVVAAPILIVALDASGAAWATLGAELVMLALIFGLVPALRALPRERHGIRVGLVGASVVATAVATQVSPWVAAVLVGSVAALASFAAARDLSALERRLLATGPQER
jgi:O-antigen/teichoic acid export membrane protein